MLSNLMDKLDWLETGISRKLTLPDVQFVTSDGVVVVRRLHRWSVGVAARRVLHCHYGWHGCDSRGGGGMRTPQTPPNPSGPVYDMLFSMLRCKLTYCLAVNSIVNRRFSLTTVLLFDTNCQLSFWSLYSLNKVYWLVHFNNVEREQY